MRTIIYARQYLCVIAVLNIQWIHLYVHVEYISVRRPVGCKKQLLITHEMRTLLVHIISLYQRYNAIIHCLRDSRLSHTIVLRIVLTILFVYATNKNNIFNFIIKWFVYQHVNVCDQSASIMHFAGQFYKTIDDKRPTIRNDIEFMHVII